MIDWNRLSKYQQVMTWWQWGFVILAISVLIWLIVWLRSYFREDAEDADESLEMLTQFRDLHQEGGLSDDEFRLIRSRLSRSAQEAREGQRTKPIEMTAKPVPANLTELHPKTTNDSPTQHATDEKEEMSERMPDEVTE